MRKHYPLFALSVVFALCGHLLFAQESTHTGWQAYKRPLHWQGLNLAQFWGTLNTATGTGALTSCTSCYYNVADGYQALNSCTTCYTNVAVGLDALFALSTGSGNTAMGWAALNVSSSSNNTAIGYIAMETSSTGSNDVAVGYGAFQSAGSESNSTMIGANAGYYEKSSTGYNTAIGFEALYGYGAGSTGSYNSATGTQAMYYNTTGNQNVAAGSYALYYNTTGGGNSANGVYSLYANTTGQGNVANGFGALYENTTGGANTAVGEDAMTGNQTGFGNTCVGSSADVNNANLTYAMALGANSGVNSSNTAVIGSPAVTSVGGYANWSNFSDGRYKKNIQSNVPGLAFINKLNPVTYTLDVDGIAAKLYKGRSSASGVAGESHNPTDDPIMKQAMQEKAAITYTGFVAQDVEKAADLLNFVFSGVDKPKDADQSFYGLRYGDFVPPLVKAVQELSASSNSKDSAINAQQSSIDSLRTQVNELRAMLLALKAPASAAVLDQNAPNPFTGSTIIGYSLPKGASSAQMRISDVNGKLLAVIPLSGSGKSTITADVSGYAAGTYSYSLFVDGKLVGTKQMISVR